MRGKLNDLKIRNAEPKEKRYTIFDGEGLYLLVAPNGGKWWRLRLGGKTTSLGTYPKVSLREAREKRDEALTKFSAKRSPYFKEIAEEWFEIKKSSWSAGHARTVEFRLKKYLYPTLGDKQIADMTVQDFVSVFRVLESRDKLETAHRVANIAGQVCRFAKFSGHITHNPVEGIAEILKKPQRKPRAAILEKEKLADLMRDIKSYGGGVVVGIALNIIPYVFVRSYELRGAKWKEIDFDNALWTIPAERMKCRKEHLVPLAPQVIELFSQLKEMTGCFELCFPGRLSSTQPMTDMCLLGALRRLGYGRDEMCVHGFRAIASTHLNEMGYRSDLIETQLAHVEKNSVRAAYNRALYLDERRRMMNDWANFLDQLSSD